MRTRSKSKLTENKATESTKKSTKKKMSCNGKKQKKEQNQWVVVAPGKLVHK